MYNPEKNILGSAYSKSFKKLSSFIVIVIFLYVLNFLIRYDVLDYDLDTKIFFISIFFFITISYYSFLKSKVRIDSDGISQSFFWNRKIFWEDVRSAKIISISLLGFYSQTRLVIRTKLSLITFNAGTPDLIEEFKKISNYYKIKK